MTVSEPPAAPTPSPEVLMQLMQGYQALVAERRRG
jgi:hypothetical protein